MADFRERIHAEPTILNGKPVIRGTRISVELILQWLSEGASSEAITEAWPHLTKDDIQVVLAYSAAVVAHEEMLVV